MEGYPDAATELDFGTPFELLIATILSAQGGEHSLGPTTTISNAFSWHGRLGIRGRRQATRLGRQGDRPGSAGAGGSAGCG